MGQVPVNFGDYGYDPLFDYKHGLQQFPAGTTSDALFPYAASTNSEGDRIILTLTDAVTALDYENPEFEVTIDITGKLTRDFYNGSLNTGFNSFRFSIDPGLPGGLYFIELKDETKRYFLKVIID